MTPRAGEPRPPKLAERFLALLVGSGPRGRSILGDAREELAVRAGDGSRLWASVWYWSYVLRFVVSYGAGGGGSDRGLSLGAGVRHAARGLRRRPGFAVTVVLTLSLGIGATTVAFAMVDGVLLRPLPYDAPDDLVLVSRVDLDWFGAPPTAANAGGWWATPPATFFDWQRRARSFAAIGAYGSASGTLRTEGEPVRISGMMASSGVFSALRVPAFLGRHLLPQDDALGADPVIVLSHGLWMRHFGGDPAVVGQTVRLDDAAFTVVGVMPEDFAFPREGTDFWIRFGDEQVLSERRDAGFLLAVARLAPGVGLAEARTEMGRVTEEMARDHREEADFDVLVFPLHEVIVASSRSGLLLLLGAALVVLLVGCANVTNLLLSRSAERRREFAVHSALGAGSGRLAGLVLGESLLLASLGGLVGGILARAALGPFISALPMTVPRAAEIAIDARVALATMLLTVGLGVVVALVPAVRTGRTELNTTLRDGGHGVAGGRGRFRSHGWLIVAEVALAVLLLSTSGTFLESFRLTSRQDPGFQVAGRQAFSVSVPSLWEAGGDERRAFFDDLVARLEALPGVTDVALASQMPLGGNYSLPPAGVETADGVEETIIHSSVVSPNYFETMGIPLLAGRTFQAGDLEGSMPVTVVSEALARRFWPGEDPLGKRVRIGNEENGVWHQVVGMVDNVLYRFADDEAVEYYRVERQYPLASGSLVLATSPGAAGVASAVAEVVRDVLPGVPVSVMSLEERARSGRSFRWARLASVLLTGLGGTAVLLALMGVYSVLSYAVVRRTRDIGIRVSLGGTGREILQEVLGGFVMLSMGGVVVGLALSVATGSVVRSALVGEVPTGPGILLAVTGLVIVTVVAASLIPAVRALRVDPLVAFRAD